MPSTLNFSATQQRCRLDGGHSVVAAASCALGNNDMLAVLRSSITHRYATPSPRRASVLFMAVQT